MKKPTNIPFMGTKEQEAELRKVIASMKSQKGAAMPILQAAQELYGYLPIEVQTIIAEELDIPLAEIYGIVTFYGQFTLEPKGRYKIGMCMGTACYVRGAGPVLDELKRELKLEVGGCSEDGKFSLDATRCLGACGLAPVMTINDEVFGKLTKDDIKTILAKYQDR